MDVICEFPKEERKLEINNLKEFLNKEKQEIDARLRRRVKYNVKFDDFEMKQVLGSGSFGRVVLAKHKASNRVYAIKLLIKKHVVKSKQIQHTLNEKVVLESLNFPFVVHLECFFQDNSHLYFTLPLISGGELFTHLRKFGRFEETLARFYGAQVLLGIEYLHYLDLVYRDLKPENLLIDSQGYVKITDFGFCKQVRGRTWTLCGTPEYLAPEVILSRGYGKSVDWWSFGVLLYEMCAGIPPFYAKDHLKLYEKIVQGKFKISSHFSPELAELVSHILQVDLSKRYGNLKGGINEIKEHSWFKNVNWLDLLNYREVPQFVPHVKNATDISNFDYEPHELKISPSETNQFIKEFAQF